ncbi:exocyst complex component 6B-like isoform X2 [Asterias amurensis]|uniref:exocyst complex component 6B-like isoform X2 n=1 Tax=Asterias amurensis TaxID=7602 RepID=UPI003AB62C34
MTEEDKFPYTPLLDTKDEHNRLVCIIEESDSTSVCQIFRAIQDGKDHECFMEHLKTRIQEHDRDIERMCNFHYQGFVDSIGQLLKVRAIAEKLKEEILNTNRALQRSGLPVIQQAEELEKTRKMHRNIVATVEHLQLCLPVLQMYCKLNEQMEAKRYYTALKTLEQLEHTQLPRVTRYRFCENMAKNIPKLRDSIMEASMSDLKDFLESIRKHSDWIGEEAMKQVQKRSNMEDNIFGKGIVAPKKESSLVEADNTNPFSDEIEEDEEISPLDKVDFSPVYRCLHIYSVLGMRETFEGYYRKQRGKQSKLAIQPHGHMYEKLEHYKKYFYQILGFFVVEDHILNTTEGLVTRQYLNDLWNTALSKIAATLRNNSAYCTDATLLLQIKDQIVLFTHTLSSYGFNTAPIVELLLDLKDQYNEILMNTWVQVFRYITSSDPKCEIFENDNYTAIIVETSHDYNEITRTIPFLSEDIEKQPYPKRLPFSEFVPKVYKQIKEFIYACHKFSQDLHLTQTERDDMIRKSTNILLTRTLSGCLTALIRKQSLGLVELVQVTVNTIHLEHACTHLESFISNITGTTGDNIHAAGLQSTNIFRDARSEAELEIYKRLNAKVDQFLELASYDWTLDEPKGHASGYIMDIIRFLEGSFKAFVHLPGKVAQTACLSACKHLSEALMEFLLDSNIRLMTMGAIQQFSFDIIQCELFANSEPVPGFREGALQMTFVQLRQLLDLFMVWDWSTYLADYNQPTSKYSRVNPHTAITILEKMRDSEKKKSNLFANFKKTDRDRKKLMDLVLKQLRALVNNGPIRG